MANPIYVQRDLSSDRYRADIVNAVHASYSVVGAGMLADDGATGHQQFVTTAQAVGRRQTSCPASVTDHSLLPFAMPVPERYQMRSAGPFVSYQLTANRSPVPDQQYPLHRWDPARVADYNADQPVQSNAMQSDQVLFASPATMYQDRQQFSAAVVRQATHTPSPCSPARLNVAGVSTKSYARMCKQRRKLLQRHGRQLMQQLYALSAEVEWLHAEEEHAKRPEVAASVRVPPPCGSPGRWSQHIACSPSTVLYGNTCQV